MKVGKHVGLLILVVFIAVAGLPKILLAQDHGSAQQQQQEQPWVEQTLGSQGGLTVVSPENAEKAYRVLWPGHRILKGTVESVSGNLLKVNTGEVLPRFLSAKEVAEKGLPPLKRGDRLELAVNDHNIVVDYHVNGQSLWHRIVRGQLAQPLPVGQEWAVIRTENGKEEAFAVRPLARSKVSAVQYDYGLSFCF